MNKHVRPGGDGGGGFDYNDHPLIVAMRAEVDRMHAIQRSVARNVHINLVVLGCVAVIAALNFGGQIAALIMRLSH